MSSCSTYGTCAGAVRGQFWNTSRRRFIFQKEKNTIHLQVGVSIKMRSTYLAQRLVLAKIDENGRHSGYRCVTKPP